MRISTSTCSYERSLWAKQTIYTCEDALRAISAAGFKVIDMNFESYCRFDAPMLQDDWREWCHRQKALADELGVEISQAHAHFFNLQEDDTISERDHDAVLRCIEGAGIMGVKQMVFHPFSLSVNGWYNFEKSFEFNLRVFKEYEKLCRPLGVHIAIENMFATTKTRSSRFACDPRDLIRLVDALNEGEDDPIFGICWDFGHAHLNTIDQPAALREIGKRLIALHVDDNHGMTDEHLAPYFGTIEWAPIMRALNDIGYDGDFTYEIFRFHYGLPHELQPLSLEYTYKIAEYMLSIR